MKNAIIIIAVLFSSFSLTAQAKFGAKVSVGMNTAGQETSYVGEPFDFINHEVTYEGSNAIKSIGAFYQEKFGYLYLRTELSYAQYTQQYNVRSFVQVANPTTFAEEKWQFVDFQVMAGLTKDNWRFGAGPIAHILVNQSTELDFISGFQSKTRSTTFGFVGGIGYDAGPMTLDVRYEFGFRSVGDHLYYVNRAARSNQNANILSFTVGVAF